MTEEILYDEKQFQRDSERTSVSLDTHYTNHENQGTLSAIRLGKQRTHGIVEDNGYAAQGCFGETPVQREQAKDLLEGVFLNTRKMPVLDDVFGGLPYSQQQKRQAATTAVGVVLGMDDVTLRNAGDSIAVAIGDNGQVKILNELQAVGDTQTISHWVSPAATTHDLAVHQERDIKKVYSWDDLKKALNSEELGEPKRIRIAVMSDGVSRSNDPATIENELAALAKQVPFDASDYATQFVETLRGCSRPKPKKDDVVMLTALQPEHPKQQSVLMAFDGVGAGGEYSAEVADYAAKTARKMVRKMSRGESLEEHNPSGDLPETQPFATATKECPDTTLGLSSRTTEPLHKTRDVSQFRI